SSERAPLDSPGAPQEPFEHAVHRGVVLVLGEADLRCRAARRAGDRGSFPLDEFLRNSRLVYRIPDHQFVQPCEFRAEIGRLQSLDRQSHHQRHLPFAPPLEIYRQLRIGNALPRPDFQDGMGGLRAALRSRVTRAKASQQAARKGGGAQIGLASAALNGERTVMVNSVTASAPFYPPRIKPAPGPLRFPRNVIKLLGNNVEMVPEQAYSEPIVIAPGPPRMAFFTGAEAVKTLLLTRQPEFPKGRVQNESLEPLFGSPMLSSEGHQWRWQRGVAAPLFRHDDLLQYGPIMSAAAEATVDKWRAASPGTVHLINKDMLRAAFRVISTTMLAGGAPGGLCAAATRQTRNV